MSELANSIKSTLVEGATITVGDVAFVVEAVGDEVYLTTADTVHLPDGDDGYPYKHLRDPGTSHALMSKDALAALIASGIYNVW